MMAPASIDMTDPIPADKITVGQLGGAFGVHGDVRLKSFCADPETVVDYGPYTTDTGLEFAQIVITGRTKGMFIARVDGITTKEQADAAKGAQLLVDRDRLPQLPDDEFYYADLIGLPVTDTGGAPMGTIKDVQNNGAGDLLELAVPGVAATVLVPFTMATVPTVDLTARKVVIDPPKGIFPDDD